MGIEPFLVASALDCVVAQRLARVLCPHCKEPYAAEDFELATRLLETLGVPPGLSASASS